MRHFLAPLLLLLAADSFAAPVPKRPVTMQTVAGRWQCSQWPGEWVVWLYPDGRYQAAYAHTPTSIGWEGVWWLDGDAIQVREWSAGRSSEYMSAYRIPLGKLTGRQTIREDVE